MNSLGATWHPDDDVTTFALWSHHATRVELCLFDDANDRFAARRVSLGRKGDVWCATVPGVRPGQLYGYRVDGPWRPQAGHRFNPSKLLVDPYARAITGEPLLDDTLFAHTPGHPHRYDGRDSVGAMPKCVVIDPRFDWGDDPKPRTPWRDTVIYECHLRGMTMTHPDVPVAERGTYAGLASPPVIDHLKRIGVTAVELMPIAQIATEPAVRARGLVNYWGYSPLGYFAPNARYAADSSRAVDEYKHMVKALHAAGIEVLLDVVFNHTAEGDPEGPTLSFRGIDNASYYRLSAPSQRGYVDMTGCGNTLDSSHPAAERLMIDCLRYWVQEMHADGFRYDLAPTLGRDADGHFHADGGLLRAIVEDPVLRAVKHIAEPWDLGPGGYRRGAFPSPWAEWDDRFRDAARGFWRGDTTRLAHHLGSTTASDPHAPQRPMAFVTCHDGFTLADLVSYERKHNAANGEQDRDGSNHNRSRNWGEEGPSDDPIIQASRQRARRNLLATLILAPAVPLLSHGDEIGRSQRGNNNAYCQDNELAWMPWFHRDDPEADLSAWLVRLIAARRHAGWHQADDEHVVFRDPAGRVLTTDASITEQTAIAVERRWTPTAPGKLDTSGLADRAECCGLLMLLNRGTEAVRFILPTTDDWLIVVDTAHDHRESPSANRLSRRPLVTPLTLVAASTSACTGDTTG